MPHARARLVSCLCAATMLLAACSGTGAAFAPSTDGPVTFDADPRTASTAYVHADAGERVVFGATTIRNDGDTAATLTAGSLGGAGTVADGAAVSTVRVVDLSAGPRDLVGAAVWPFEDYRRRSVPLQGFSLQPGTEAELLFVVTVDRTGQWYWPTTSVRYEAGGHVLPGPGRRRVRGLPSRRRHLRASRLTAGVSREQATAGQSSDWIPASS